jgi:hypothetical protein
LLLLLLLLPPPSATGASGTGPTAAVTVGGRTGGMPRWVAAAAVCVFGDSIEVRASTAAAPWSERDTTVGNVAAAIDASDDGEDSILGSQVEIGACCFLVFFFNQICANNFSCRKENTASTTKQRML